MPKLEWFEDKQLIQSQTIDATQLWFLSDNLNAVQQAPFAEFKTLCKDYLVILPAGVNWILFVPEQYSSTLTINRIHPMLMKILHHNDQIACAGKMLRFFAEERVQLTMADPEIIAQLECPVILKRFAVGDIVVRCPKCRLAHLERGWKSATQCGSSPWCGHSKERG